MSRCRLVLPAHARIPGPPTSLKMRITIWHLITLVHPKKDKASYSLALYVYYFVGEFFCEFAYLNNTSRVINPFPVLPATSDVFQSSSAFSILIVKQGLCFLLERKPLSGTAGVMLQWLPAFGYPRVQKGYWEPVTSTINWCEEVWPLSPVSSFLRNYA